MRFDSGLHAHAGAIEGYPWLDEWREQAQFCEEAGFTGVWIPEHHFFWDGWGAPTATNPILMGAHLAAHTTRLRLGQCGVAINDWHPVRVAEDIATLDHMSNGRVDFGFMRGLNNRVNGNFNTNADRRDQKRANELLWESLDIVLKAWTGEPFQHKGRFYTLPMPGWREESQPSSELDPRYYSPEGELTALAVQPVPVQKPHPPIWVMADSRESHIAAARRGVNVLCWGRSFKATREVWTAYREAAAGKNPGHSGGRVAAMRPLFIAPTMEQAERIMRPAINGLFKRVSDVKNPNWSRKGFLASDEELTSEDLTSDWFDFLVRHEWALVGTPEHVAEKLTKFEEELGCDHFVMYWTLPYLTPRELRASQELFADRVMPRFRAATPGPAR